MVLKLKQIYGEGMCYLYAVIHTGWMLSLIPAETLFISIDDTNREIYELEKHNYRHVLALQNRGDDIDKRTYKMYKHIAQKYNWRYIKELHDKE